MRKSWRQVVVGDVVQQVTAMTLVIKIVKLMSSTSLIIGQIMGNGQFLLLLVNI